MNTAYIRCPHCDNRMKTAGHKQMTPLLKDITAICTNPDCLFSAHVSIEIYRQIHPSIAPKPEIQGQLLKTKG